MRTLRLIVTDSEYEAFQQTAKAAHQTMGQMLREAVATLREQPGAKKLPLRHLPVLPGHRALGELPSRADLADEMFPDEVSNGQP
jgi:hypothetical protein